MKNFKNILIQSKTTIKETISVIDKGALQIAFVVDEEQRLLGTVTDGDIRRGLLNGVTLENMVELVMHRDFRALPEDCQESWALRLMRDEVLHQIPGLDSEGRVVRLFLLEELFKSRTLPNWVVLMAGGQGKRLRPMTDTCPKPMLRVGNKPMLEIILEQCAEAGFRKFFISVNYLKQQVIGHFGDGSRWGIEIHYLEEEQPLGTAGALGLLPECQNQPILVMNGDVLTRVDHVKLLRFHEEQQATATICVREHESQIPYGVVQTEGPRVLCLEEKPVLKHYVNAGMYVLNPDLLDLLPSNQSCDMPMLLENGLAHNRSVVAFPIHEYWLDVGHPETFEQANSEWCS
ncbi:MAG: NTP transferase domain-containing protein [Gammaproteobacteria bacterium]|jgi:dTDP-glucose pyrophosphorylase|nr:NTP transferase domain-containing protein [Gammaproteobacteria bacterium]